MLVAKAPPAILALVRRQRAQSLRVVQHVRAIPLQVLFFQMLSSQAEIGKLLAADDDLALMKGGFGKNFSNQSNQVKVQVQLLQI